MKLKKRILIQTLSASLAFTLFLSLMFFLAVAGIRKTVLSNSGDLGDSAADVGAYALEEQVADKIIRMAADMALILDEKLIKIENHTRTTADIAGSIYTTRESRRPRPLPYTRPGEMSPAGPYLHTAPGVPLARIRAEAELAANIADVLRQITVIDRGITTSTIGGDSGYAIIMDAYPWPAADFDHRQYSWYHGAKETGDVYWTGVYLDLRGRGPAVSCAAPFYDSSEGDDSSGNRRVFKGVARSTVLLEDFSAIIDSAKVGRTGYLFLVDKSGLKLFSSGSVDIRAGENGGIEGENYLKSTNPRLRSLARSMTLGASGMTELELDGVQVYIAYAPIHTLGWSLGVAIPAREISAPAWLIEEQIRALTGKTIAGMDRYILILAGVIAVMLLLSLLAIALLSIRFTEDVTGPILALSEGVREVSGGNLEREVCVKTGDELEQLAVSFNAMTGRLREHIAETARVTAERQRIATELDIATRIQTSMLPNNFPPFPGRINEFDLYAMVHPAKEVGGDFYDFFFIDDDHFAVIVADVSGKGIPAALFMAITATLARNHLRAQEAAEISLENVNRELCRNNMADMFVTLWLGLLEISSGRLEYVNAGHNPPLIKSRGGSATFLVSPPDLVLAGADDTIYRRRETRLAEGDTLFLYTDGITEAENTAGAFYGKERLRDFLDARGDLQVRELLPRLRADIAEFCAGAEQSDDITMLALRVSRERPVTRSITLRADPDRLGELIAFIGGELGNATCPENIRGQIELAAEEIFVNIARYAYTNSALSRDAFEVIAEYGFTRSPGGSVVTLGFSDRGEPFNPLERADPDLTLPLERREVGGLGVLLVKRTMDTVQYSYDGGINRLVITKSW
jgi:sigma-B regulation protein RsbU (phosphoserine phosphatase)